MSVVVKICGLSTAESLDAAIAAGADMAGFVFFPKSPRHVGLEPARELGLKAAGRIAKVALFVDETDDAVAAAIAALAPDLLQLHGRESPGRVGEIKSRFGLPVMKAVGVAERSDLSRVRAYEGIADMLLLDAKPPPDAAVPGGAGVAFDWELLRGAAFSGPWMLSGGLDPSNVARALRATNAPGVDVSSGVERARGVKDNERIKAFVAAARTEANRE